jgi:hypothetical protein
MDPSIPPKPKAVDGNGHGTHDTFEAAMSSSSKERDATSRSRPGSEKSAVNKGRLG